MAVSGTVVQKLAWQRNDEIKEVWKRSSELINVCERESTRIRKERFIKDDYRH